jgi:alanine dehydrogenase
MIVGVPKEIKEGENRVAITPAGVRAFVENGHRVLVQRRAGLASGLSDDSYRKAGARLVSQREVWRTAGMVLKVKEPLPTEYPYLRKGMILFTFLHLASSRETARALLENHVSAVGYETVEKEDGSLPLLRPMSEVAGRLAVQMGAYFLSAHRGGRGILVGGVPGVPPAEVVIVGCGAVGLNAAKVAIGMGAHVTILDINHDRLQYLDDVMHGNVITVYSNPHTLERSAKYADLLVGAALVPGARAPLLITAQMVKQMKPGSVIVDVAVDQGGCIETTRPTTHANPTFVRCGVLHYCVTNMPAAVPRTSTFALTNATLRFALEIAGKGLAQAMRDNSALARGLNVAAGKCFHPAVAAALRLPAHPLPEILSSLV